jgi:hypothetical protein
MQWPGPYWLQALTQVATFGAACVALIWLATRGHLARRALREVLDHPGILVPAAMVSAAMIGLHRGFGIGGHENPLAVPRSFDFPLFAEGSWLVFGLVAAAIAGQIGLLEAVARGGRPDAEALVAGVRRHFATIAIAKVLVAVAARVVMGWTHPSEREGALIFLLVPSLLLAPVLGIASRHPGRPIRALVETLRLSSRNVFAVGWPLIGQTAVLVGLVALVHSVPFLGTPVSLFGLNASAISFNHYPFAAEALRHWAGLVATAAAVFASAVFVTAHWLGAGCGYRRPDEAGPGLGS